jgi:hypothetical protein
MKLNMKKMEKYITVYYILIRKFRKNYTDSGISSIEIFGPRIRLFTEELIEFILDELFTPFILFTILSIFVPVFFSIILETMKITAFIIIMKSRRISTGHLLPVGT